MRAQWKKKEEKKTYPLNTTQRTNCNILIPNPALGKVNNVFFGDLTNNPLNLGRVHPPASSNDLATNVFGDSGGAVKREEERRLELGFCALDFRLCHSLCEAGPLAKGEVHEVVDSSNFIGDEIDSPETGCV